MLSLPFPPIKMKIPKLTKSLYICWFEALSIRNVFYFFYFSCNLTGDLEPDNSSRRNLPV